MLFEADRVTKRFGGLVAVNDLSFTVRQSEILGIFGPNGSGKTTTLSLIAGMIEPTEGRFSFEGSDITGVKPFRIADRGIVKTFQNPQLFPELNVRAHMRIAAHLRSKRWHGWRRIRSLFQLGEIETGESDRIDEVLRLCRLTALADHRASSLSYGAEKMLGVAMAMMCEPKLLLLDEPTSGLGHAEVENLEVVLRSLRDHGVTLCVIDHKVTFLGRLADRAIALRHGTKIAEGPSQDVLRHPAVIEAYLGRAHA